MCDVSHFAYRTGRVSRLRRPTQRQPSALAVAMELTLLLQINQNGYC